MKLTNLTKKDFDKILENYDIGKYKSSKHIWWAFTNSIYRLNTTKGTFFIKIFEKTSLKSIKNQLKIIEYLKIQDLNRVSLDLEMQEKEFKNMLKIQI